jgi:phage terminase large subunit-like protein
MGGSPILLILDETGQVVGAKDAFIDAVITAQGAHDAPLRIVISTQAASDSDLLSIWIDDAMTGRDPQTVCHLYAASDGADVLDPDAWAAANPALGNFRSLADVSKMANDASRMPSFENTFRNLYLNQRISINSPFISRNSWKACAGAPCPIAECDEVYGGLDLSGKTDLTALVLYGHRGGEWNAYPYFWTPRIGLEERAKRDRAPYDTWLRWGISSPRPAPRLTMILSRIKSQNSRRG